jgi:release factor glutamine methyltransferase
VRWGELLTQSTGRLGSHDARRIVEEASGHEGAELYLHLEDPVTERSLAYFDGMVERRATGEPLQYVLGRWGFRTLDLAIDRRVLIPRPETEQVVSVVLDELDRRGGRDRPTLVADLGTGSGAIGLSVCVERLRSQVVLTERSPDAAALARANTAALGRAGARVRLLEGSWFDALPTDLAESFDVIAANPPYVCSTDLLPPEVADWEPHEALFAGPDGLDDLRVIIGGAPTWLAVGGGLVVELDPRQVDEAARLATVAGLVDVDVFPDLAGRPRALRARRAA